MFFDTFSPFSKGENMRMRNYSIFLFIMVMFFMFIGSYVMKALNEACVNLPVARMPVDTQQQEQPTPQTVAQEGE